MIVVPAVSVLASQAASPCVSEQERRHERKSKGFIRALVSDSPQHTPTVSAVAACLAAASTWSPPARLSVELRLSRMVSLSQLSHFSLEQMASILVPVPLVGRRLERPEGNITPALIPNPSAAWVFPTSPPVPPKGLPLHS